MSTWGVSTPGSEKKVLSSEPINSRASTRELSLQEGGLVYTVSYNQMEEFFLHFCNQQNFNLLFYCFIRMNRISRIIPIYRTLNRSFSGQHDFMKTLSAEEANLKDHGFRKIGSKAGFLIFYSFFTLFFQITQMTF